MIRNDVQVQQWVCKVPLAFNPEREQCRHLTPKHLFCGCAEGITEDSFLHHGADIWGLTEPHPFRGTGCGTSLLYRLRQEMCLHLKEVHWQSCGFGCYT